jgi:hypothetical protein
VRVVLKVDITGLRDGVEWPARGQVVDLPDAEAVDLLNAGLARSVSDERPVESAAIDTKPQNPKSRKRS